MRYLIITKICVISIVLLISCQSPIPATPNAAEVVDLRITTPELASSLGAYPEFPSSIENPYIPPVDIDNNASVTVNSDVIYPDSNAEPTLDVKSDVSPVVKHNPTLVPYVFKTSQPGTATIHGMLVVMDPLVLIPAPDDAIYLVPLADNSEGVSTVSPIEKGITPQAQVDEQTGEFYFTNISPGQYIVVVITIGGTEIPVRVFDSQNLAIISVKETDLGRIIEAGNLSL